MKTPTLLLALFALTLGARADILLVNGIAGTIPAGRYSVALTLGALVTYGPFVLALVSYPHLADLHEDELGPFVARLSRLAVLTSLAPAIVMAAMNASTSRVSAKMSAGPPIPNRVYRERGTHGETCRLGIAARRRSVSSVPDIDFIIEETPA